VLSGYRTENTNAKLRKRSKGVAKYSLHMKGQAADIYIPGYSAKKVQQTAIELGAGGVGLYSGSARAASANSIRVCSPCFAMAINTVSCESRGM